jgi:Fanconi anemia group J protein
VRASILSYFLFADFYPKLGNAIASVVEAIPRGGVLIFLPSYSFLRKCIKSWNPQASRWSSHDDEGVDSDIWFRFLRSKGTVVVEPTGSQADFEAAKERFSQSICRDGKAVLLAVFRGKMSEGISFNDDNARAVICVGLPLPNSFDRSITAKKSYNDEQRKLRHKTSLLPGSEWYSQQAYRAIAQALGRCIRHAGDYGTVVLMDSRHCDDGAPTDGLCRQHCNLPKWMRYSVRNLTMSTSRMPVPGNPPIYGGYAGLASELGEFFTSAKTFSDAVVAKFQKEFAQAQAPERHAQHSFNRTTGEWSSKRLPSLTVKKE